MSSCEKMSNCPFFNGKIGHDMPSVVSSLKNKYCRANKEGCARYIVFKSGKVVPDDLFPNDSKKADEILNS